MEGSNNSPKVGVQAREGNFQSLFGTLRPDLVDKLSRVPEEVQNNTIPPSKLLDEINKLVTRDRTGLDDLEYVALTTLMKLRITMQLPSPKEPGE